MTKQIAVIISWGKKYSRGESSFSEVDYSLFSKRKYYKGVLVSKQLGFQNYLPWIVEIVFGSVVDQSMDMLLHETKKHDMMPPMKIQY